MKAIWLKGKPDTFAENVRQSADVLEQLTNILESLKPKEAVDVDYDSPSWSHKQAHRNGYARALTDVLELLKP